MPAHSSRGDTLPLGERGDLDTVADTLSSGCRCKACFIGTPTRGRAKALCATLSPAIRSYMARRSATAGNDDE
jgi:hypothetical protein